MTEHEQALPQVKELFKELREGKHLCMENGDLYWVLHRRFEEYQALFAQLGFTLAKHRRNFYFFDGEKVGKTAQRIAIFFFILVEYVGDHGRPIEESIMGKEWKISELPHLSTERYRNYLRPVEVIDEETLRQEILNTMDRLGFAELLPSNNIRFCTPAYRLLDLCATVAELEDAEQDK